MAEIKSLLAATENPHHRMVMRLALHTGLRREEIAAFRWLVSSTRTRWDEPSSTSVFGLIRSTAAAW